MPAQRGDFENHQVLTLLACFGNRQAAEDSVARPARSSLVNERAYLSPDMAIQIEMAIGVSVKMLMRMQNT